MIIGNAIGNLLTPFTVNLTVDGQAVNDRTVNYHYGDQKELVKWINFKDKTNTSKYPLVWYVPAQFVEHNNVYYTQSNLIILQNTVLRWFNDERYVRTYTEVIDPVYRALRLKIEQSPYMHVIGPNQKEQYKLKDEPSYGVNTNDIRLGQNDFSSRSTKKDESVSLDYVDARIVNINFRIEPDCLN